MSKLETNGSLSKQKRDDVDVAPVFDVLPQLCHIIASYEFGEIHSTSNNRNNTFTDSIASKWIGGTLRFTNPFPGGDKM